jgi:hypothetical protein
MKKLDIIKWFLEIILIIMVFYLYSLVDKDLLLSIRGFERIAENGRIIIAKNDPTDKLITIGSEFKDKQLILDYDDVALENYLGTYMNYLQLKEIDYILIKNKDYLVYQDGKDLYLSTNFIQKNKYYKIEKIEEDKLFLGEKKFFLKPLSDKKMIKKVNKDTEELYYKVKNKTLVIKAENL